MKDDGGPAFPTGSIGSHIGMSLRDWFAGQVLNGVISEGKLHPDTMESEIAQSCYEVADAMLEAQKVNESSASNTHNPAAAAGR